ncbi:ricin-type beta-trefoil lectin domain protein [Streptomyces sp. NPDC003388]
MSARARGLVLVGAAAALVGGGTGSAVAAGATPAPKLSYSNIQLQKVWSGRQSMCWSLDGAKSSGAVLKIRGCAKKSSSAAKTQTFTLNLVDSSRRLFVIKNKLSGKCLYASSKRVGTTVKQAGCNSRSSAQRWAIGNSKFYNKSSNLVITALKDASGTKLTFTKASDSKDYQQRFDIRGQ